MEVLASGMRQESTDTGSNGDPWGVLEAFADRSDIDGTLRNAIHEALAAHRGLLGVTVAITTRYRNLIDAIPDAITINDQQGRILDANAAAAAIYGHEQAVLRQLNVHNLNPALPTDHLASVLEATRGGKTVVTETLAAHDDGRSLALEVHSSLYTDNGEARIISVSRDLRLGRRANDARAAEARFLQLMHMTDKGMFVQDEHGKIVACNPAACRIFGQSETDMLALLPEHFSCWEFLDETGQPLAPSELPSARAMRTGTPAATTLIGLLLPRLRTERWLSVSAVPQFREGSSQPFQVISTFGDVTEIKRETELFAQTQMLANIGGWQLDLANDSLAWTRHMYTILDLPPGTAMTIERMSRFFHNDDRKKFRQMLGDARGATPGELELRVTSAIGRRRWVRVAVRPVLHRQHVHALIGTLQDITDPRHAEEKLRMEAVLDPLTGLSNRDAILRSITQAIATAGVGDGPTILYLNLDCFRVVNNELGYGVGDQLLKTAAERLRGCLPAGCEFARFGGDEFMLLMPAGSQRVACEQLAHSLAGEFDQPFRCDEHEFRLTVSIGMASHPDDGVGAQQLVASAGTAMTEAKRRGRSTWLGFSHELGKRASNRMRVEQQLRNAVDNNELRIEFQPQVDLLGGRVLGAEALLRWRNESLGELRPDLFIPLAEATGDIIAIGEWTIRESCRQMREWRDDGIMIERVAVNVSYSQILSESFVGTVMNALRDHRLPGEALELELTERVLVEDLDNCRLVFAMLRGLGVRLVIDDFGEGYSALGYLRRLPVDGLKISYGFLHNVPADATDTAICEAIIRIAKSLGLLIIAEGVETEEQREFLLKQDTYVAQGHLFSRALAPEAFTVFVRSRNSAAQAHCPRSD